MYRVFLRFAPSRLGHPPLTYCETLSRPDLPSPVCGSRSVIEVGVAEDVCGIAHRRVASAHFGVRKRGRDKNRHASSQK